jgi:peptidylprolyl isomerase/FKBP-type peptidyl-prolyl cis-trans isomerase FklB
MRPAPLARRLAFLVGACAIVLAGGACAQSQSADAFLAANAQAPGIVTVPALQYKIVRSGPADGVHPRRSDDITVRYEGRLLSGVVFDSSAKRGEPVTFPLGRLIPGWVIALQLMRPGDEWILYVPPQLAYGFTDRGVIPAGSVLVFDVTLISVTPLPPDPPPAH